ncbi:hypothetical protein [Anaeromicropila populeti]|uniref:ABC-2 family transporter protein n=1 Tax=Anaeromicropila populeti TaxID=37658 RepID=A0A1I6HR38_9FIRM|nr:hypothetical protein [Anaeromicropila populeti]SFR56730.1 hypothetical protein SAMN05661086_00172 [Anaeromicropila populeti]
MKTLHTLKIELWKTIGNLGFVVSIFITFGLLCTTEVYIDTMTGKAYNVIEALLQINQEIAKTEISFAAPIILQGAFSSYFAMFIPIIAAFPFIPNFCAERNSGLIRYTIQRTGKIRYYITKFLSAILGGGLSVLLGYCLYGAMITMLFPSIKDYNLPKEILTLYTGTNIMLRNLLLIIGIFLYGCFSTIPAFFLAAFVRNRYIITCVPFMVTYLFSSSLTKLIYDGMATQNQKLIDIGNTLKPEGISRLYQQDAISRNCLLIYLVFMSICFLLFVIIMNRRFDLGE